MSKLSNMLNAKIEGDGLTMTSAAEKAGISLPSFIAAVKGKSVPNSRSIDKYAAFLGVSVDEVRAASSDADSPRGKGKGKGTGKRGPGRPPGTGKRGPGRPPGRGRGRPRKSGAINAGSALDQVRAALDQANEILADDLAMKVHNLSAKQRAAIGAILTSLG